MRDSSAACPSTVPFLSCVHVTLTSGRVRAADVGQRRLCVAEAKVITKSSWAMVSSARGPRAVRTAAMAASGELPAATRKHAAIVPLRPSPLMQVTTTALP